MNEAFVKYKLWLDDVNINAATKQELLQISGQPQEIEDRFYKDLAFGTGGLRGVLGAGTNRMNKYTVGMASQGLAHYVLGLSYSRPAVVIAYDSRNQSPEFALETALVMAGNGIIAYVFRSLRPTPELSFAVRSLHACAGVVITASHNPPEYNGFKAYDANGCQYLMEQTEQIIHHIEQLNSLTDVMSLKQEEAEKAGLLRWIDEEVDGPYSQAIASLSRIPEQQKSIKSAVHIVYTPLHGAGNKPVRRVLQEAGFDHVYVVPEQELPDALFSTVTSPNPEEQQAFTLALALAKEKAAELVIGTDPDCDRMGVAVKNEQGEFMVLTGNQTGAILIHYLLQTMKLSGDLPANGVVCKTIVTSEMGATIAKSYGIEVINTLTGFKYIGEKITEMEKNQTSQFIFGYEESYGYLAGTHCRDKDAVAASLLISEAAAYYKSHGRSLYEVLQQLYQEFGFFREKLESITLKGKQGFAQMSQMMERLRSNPPQSIHGLQIVEIQDYLHGFNGLPAENVLKYFLSDGSWFCIRPSGTEPKIKIYFAVCCSSELQAVEAIDQLSADVIKYLA